MKEKKEVKIGDEKQVLSTNSLSKKYFYLQLQKKKTKKNLKIFHERRRLYINFRSSTSLVKVFSRTNCMTNSD